jgi:hypothetical protein
LLDTKKRKKAAKIDERDRKCFGNRRKCLRAIQVDYGLRCVTLTSHDGLEIPVGCHTLDEDPWHGLVWYEIQLAGSALMENWVRRSTHSCSSYPKDLPLNAKHSVGVVGEEQRCGESGG